jgi:SHS2 domain-containing protein
MIEEEAFVPVETVVERVDPRSLRARVLGGRVAPEARAAASELKAVTWHQLAFEPDPDGRGWRARVILDV